ncbi:MAG: HAMP domain-containing protein [Calditrichaeota bacterium]|nr:MAG: HAMP domain-containing protein [Calditrichota bacterium]
MSYKNLKLGTKQIFGFGFILFIMASLNFFTIHKMREIKNEIDEVASNWLPRISAISEINLHTSNLRIHQLQHAIATDESRKQEQQRQMITLIDKINENIDTYEHLKTESEARQLYSSRERRLYKHFDEKWEEYLDLSFSFMALSSEHNSDEAIDLLHGKAQDTYKLLRNDLEGMAHVNYDESSKAAQRAEFAFLSTRKVITSLFILTIIFSAVITIVFIRYITIPVKELEKAARQVTKGDLKVRLAINSKDEIGNMATSFNLMTKALNEARDQMEDQAAQLKKQQLILQATNEELEAKSHFLEEQKEEIQNKNTHLQNTLNELHETQKQLLMKEKMAALGDLVAGVAHEINNPLGVIRSSADVCERCINTIENNGNDQGTSLKTVTELLKKNIDVTFTASERIGVIVDSLKNFARLDEANYQVVDIHEGIDSALTLLTREMQGRVKVEKKYGKIPPVACYPASLNQVFLALSKNAIQAMKSAGHLTISTRLQGQNIKISFKDDGVGIAPDKLEHIFDFGFSRRSGERVKLGSGLATAYNTIQKHNGEINISSEEGKGTLVEIILPISGNIQQNKG